MVLSKVDETEVKYTINMLLSFFCPFLPHLASNINLDIYGFFAFLPLYVCVCACCYLLLHLHLNMNLKVTRLVFKFCVDEIIIPRSNTIKPAILLLHNSTVYPHILYSYSCFLPKRRHLKIRNLLLGAKCMDLSILMKF